MDYLGKDSNLDVMSYISQKGEKLKDYRKYLVDKDVILSITKCDVNLQYRSVGFT